MHPPDEPSQLLRQFAHLLTGGDLPGPVLDLASGNCSNGIFLAKFMVSVECWDVSPGAMALAQQAAQEAGVSVRCREIDLEREGINPLPEDYYGGILVFRYLHRPLMECIRKALKTGGILVYETYTLAQAAFGRPRNPAHLLRPGELREWFAGWEIIHDFEGTMDDPLRAVAQLVCRKAG
jgi:tellurite methyltransferase